MKIGIVGSRTFPQLKLVEWFIKDLPLGVTIVSGGARGVDQAAVEAARNRGLAVMEYFPQLDGCIQQHEFAERYYARNQQIVDNSNLVVAFTEKDKGGTWDTIKRARRAGVPLKIIRPSLLFPGDADSAEPEPVASMDDIEPEGSEREKRKGKGPFALKRVSLGSYALRRKCYIEPEEWAEIVVDKDNNPHLLAEKMTPAFLQFFETNRRLGIIHAVTTPPRSVRNLGRVHVMDLVASRVAEELGVEHVQIFKPWEKSTRGRHAKHGEIAIAGEVERFIGRVVWVIDDVTTTNFTLRAAVQSLIAMEIHAHGLAYIVMG